MSGNDIIRVPYLRFRSETGKKWEWRRVSDCPLEYDCRQCYKYKCEKIKLFRRIQKRINAKYRDSHLGRYESRQLTLLYKNIEDVLENELDELYHELGVAINGIVTCLEEKNAESPKQHFKELQNSHYS